jgi:hypothetical protein
MVMSPWTIRGPLGAGPVGFWLKWTRFNNPSGKNGNLQKIAAFDKGSAA